MTDASRHFGRDLLYRSSTSLEKSLVDLDGDRITDIPAELIRDIWDPDRCPINLLQYLSWAMGVEYWRDGWSETTKRSWTKVQWLFKSQRGTEGGLRMAIDYAGRDVSRWGYKVSKVTVRPQQVFSGPSLTKAQREDWLSRLPQVRFWRMRETGYASKWKAFYNASNSLRLRDRRFCLGGTLSGDVTVPTVVAPTPTDAIEHLRGRVRWIEKGVETDVTCTEFGSYFRVHLRSVEDSKVFSGRCFGLNRYFVPSDAWRRLLTIQPTQTLPWRNPVTPSMQAVISEPELVKVASLRNHSVFCDTPIARTLSGDHVPKYGSFFVPTTAPYRIYHRYPVLDQSIRELRQRPVQFMGTGRFSFPKFTAWADVSVGTEQSKWQAGDGFHFPKLKFWIPHDGEPVRQVRLAAVASKSLRDKILLKLGPKPKFTASARPILADIDQVIVGRP